MSSGGASGFGRGKIRVTTPDTSSGFESAGQDGRSTTPSSLASSSGISVGRGVPRLEGPGPALTRFMGRGRGLRLPIDEETTSSQAQSGSSLPYVTVGRGFLQQRNLLPSAMSSLHLSETATPSESGSGRGLLFRRTGCSQDSTNTEPRQELLPSTSSSFPDLPTNQIKSSEIRRPSGLGRGTVISESTVSTSLLAVKEGTDGVPNDVVYIEAPMLSMEDSASLKPMSSEDPVVDKGSEGRPINVITNYIRLEFTEKRGVYHYLIQFEPEVVNLPWRVQFVKENLPVKRGIRCYDGGSILYLPERLPSDQTVISCLHPLDASAVKMIVTFKRSLSWHECVPLLGTLIKNCTKELKLARLGRQMFNPKAAKMIPAHKLQIWPGYVTAVEEREDGVYLTCDLIHRVLRQDTAYDVLEAIQRINPREMRNMAEKELLGCSVMTHYNNKMYRIDAIAWDMTPMHTFDLKNGKKMSFMEYYKTMYNLDIKDDKQPLLLSKVKRSIIDAAKNENEPMMIMLVPELVNLTGITDAMRSKFTIMKDIAMYTRLTPQQRSQGLKIFIQSLKENEGARKLLQDWGLHVPDDAIQLQARVINTPKVQFGNKDTLVDANSDWARAARSNPAFRGVDIVNWILIHHQRDGRRASTFTSNITQVARNIGIMVRPPRVIVLNNDRLNHLINTMQTAVDTDVQVVVVILSSQREDVYSAIKKFCSHDMAVASQVILSNTLARDDRARSVVQNIALQMIAKLGGALWAVPTPMKKTMVCGIDAYHDKTDGNSVGAFVASIDSLFTTYMSEAAMQPKRVELMNALAPCLMRALIEYAPRNNGLPDRIVIYRDGVDEGTIKNVLEHEWLQLRAACSKFQQGYCPKIVYIVVLKRIAIRYFSTEGGTLDQPPPGTVVDHTVTKRNYRDFLIVSQMVRHGTVAPTHYVVARDDCNMKIDHIQKMTYFFCHMYYNWPGTVRVPGPCLYAHKLAGMVGQHIRALPNKALSNRLHYL